MVVDPNVLEQEVLKFWDEQGIFQESIERNRHQEGHSDPFIIYEGPPTANGKPGLHHAFTRTYKDIIGRFQTMQGRLVERRAGWDEHGLPVEIEVQKELGLHTKAKIEEYGVKEFNVKCAESTQKYIKEWEDFTKRMGYWLDFKKAYRTSDPRYIKWVWTILGQMYEDGLIYRDNKVVPWACDSGTVMSNHEVALGYKEVVHKGMWVRFKLCDDTGNSLVAWTTTPWTLPSNMALAVNPDLDYKFCQYPDQPGSYSLWEHGPVVKTVKGRDLVGQEYYHPFTHEHCCVYAADFVQAEKSGIVHIAPAFGQDDYELWKKEFSSVSIKCHVNPDGTFNNQAPKCLQGNLLHSNFETANQAIQKYIAENGLLECEFGGMLKHNKETKDFEYVTHQYPHNWRTGKPLIYFLRPCWYVAVNKIRDKMVAANEKVEWFPTWVKNGRFGEWLRGNVDWAISRERYWGTPLPFYMQDGLKTVVQFPPAPHRPEADARYQGTQFIGLRTPEVLDCWFDSGAMPFAAFDEEYQQADVICEAIDQTRGWFYSLLAIGVALKGEAPYKNVVCLGHVLDKHGQKMSKTKGNAIDPWEMFSKYGADTVRWYMAKCPTGNQLMFNEEDLKTIRQVFLNRLWNSFNFLQMYHDIEKPQYSPVGFKPMDRWILGKLDALIDACRNYYTLYQFSMVVTGVEFFLDELSNVWIRANRTRFYGQEKTDEAAFYTLRLCLMALCQVMAPIMPFVTEHMWQKMPRIGPGRTSVHLTEWPGEIISGDTDHFQEMDQALAIIAEGHKMRNTAGIKVRQALQAIYVPDRLRMEHFEDFVREELNVKTVIYFVAEVGSKQDVLRLDTTITPELLAEGVTRDFIRAVQVLRKDAGFQVTDRIDMTVNWMEDEALRTQVDLHREEVSKKLGINDWRDQTAGQLLGGERVKVGEHKIFVKVVKCPEKQ